MLATLRWEQTLDGIAGGHDLLTDFLTDQVDVLQGILKELAKQTSTLRWFLQ